MKWKKRLERKEQGGGWALGRSRGWGGSEGHDIISNPTRFIFLEVGISGT